MSIYFTSFNNKLVKFTENDFGRSFVVNQLEFPHEITLNVSRNHLKFEWSGEVLYVTRIGRNDTILAHGDTEKDMVQGVAYTVNDGDIFKINELKIQIHVDSKKISVEDSMTSHIIPLASPEISKLPLVPQSIPLVSQEAPPLQRQDTADKVLENPDLLDLYLNSSSSIPAVTIGKSTQKTSSQSQPIPLSQPFSQQYSSISKDEIPEWARMDQDDVESVDSFETGHTNSNHSEDISSDISFTSSPKIVKPTLIKRQVDEIVSEIRNLSKETSKILDGLEKSIKKVRPRKESQKEGNTIKRMTAYGLYSRLWRREATSANPTLSSSEITQQLRDKWENEPDRLWYEERVEMLNAGEISLKHVREELEGGGQEDVQSEIDSE